MPDTKITALTAISTVDPAADPLVIVDVSDTSMAASGTTKKATINQLLGASGTATLASATITGNLTAAAVIPSGSTVPTNGLYLPTANNLGFAYNSTLGMTLNSTGLGVGTGPSYKLHVFGASPALTIQDNSSAAGGVGGTINFIAYTSGTSGANIEAQIKGVKSSASSAGELLFFTSDSSGNSQQRFMVDGTGNLGIGVQPSAWNTSAKAFEIGTAGNSVFSSGATFVEMTNNAYLDSVSNWVRVNTGNAAARFRTSGSGFLWLQAAAGANPITWTQAMTLDESGNLLVGTTGLNGSWNTKLTLSNDSGTTKWAVGPYLGGVTNFLISAGASAGVYLNGTAATSWTSASDERLKDIIEPISNAIAKVGSLRAVIGKFKFDENNTRKPFLIAQDIQAVLPEAVDASNPEKLGVAYTDVIPLLVAAIKELTAEVNALKNA